MLVGATAFTLSASRIRSANLNVVRMQDLPYIVNDETVRNQFMARIINKTSSTQNYQIVTSSGVFTDYTVQLSEDQTTIKTMGEEVRPVIISVDRSVYQGSFPLDISILNEAGKTIMTRKIEFLGPDPRLLDESK